MVDPDDTSDSPRIILNSVVTKVERGGTAQDPWVKVTAGTKFSHFELNFVAKNLKSRGGKFTRWHRRKNLIQLSIRLSKKNLQWSYKIAKCN